MKKAITLFLCICLTLAFFTGCGSKSEKTDTDKPAVSDTGSAAPSPAIGTGSSGGNAIIEADKYQETFRIGGQMECESLDFQESLYAYYVVSLTHDTLITYLNDSYQPALATEWTKLDSLTYEFKLRQGVTFHDGSPFTAADVVYTLAERAPEHPSCSVNTRLSCIDKIEAVDDYTVRFTLSKPNADFLLYIAQPYSSIMSKTALEKDPEGYVYGTGPWKVVDFKPSISVSMDLYDGFWGEMPKSQHMIYTTYPEDAARVVALQSGEVDCCLVVNSADNATVENDDRIVPVLIEDAGLSIIGFNLNDPILADINFRKAVCYAINVDDVYAVSCEGYGKRAKTIWGGGAFGETDDIEGYYYDPELAKEYLAKSSYNGETIEMLCGVQEYVTNATIFADMLADVGINVVLNEKDFMGVVTSYSSGDFQMLSWAITWSASGDDCRLYHYTGARNNYTQVSDSWLDEMIDKGLVEEDEAARKQIYHDIQQYVVDNALMLPVYRSQYYCAEAKNCGGIVWNADCTAYNFRYACIALVD